MSIKLCTVFIFVGLLMACSKNENSSNITDLIGDGFGIQSVTWTVKNLDSSRNYFNKVLGFNMPKKYEKSVYEGTQVSYLNFPDWTSIELLSAIDSAKTKNPIIAKLLKRDEAIGIYSFSTSSIDTTIKWLKSQGFKTNSVRAGRVSNKLSKEWSWDDGGPQWRSIDLENPPTYLPTFISYPGLPYKEFQDAWKPAAWRKYSENNPNGVVGISYLKLVVKDLKKASSEFEKMGLNILQSNDTLIRFKILHGQELHLLSPKSANDELSKYLKTHGPGLYAIGFEVKNFKETYDFFKKKLPKGAFSVDIKKKRLTISIKYGNGIQVEFVEESKAQSDLAKIYAYKEPSKMDSVTIRYATKLYTQYCALCHGKDRQGYAADNAPSLRSKTLMAVTYEPQANYNYLAHTISYGRTGTAMAPYAKNQGGPLDEEDIFLLIDWLHQASGVKKPIKLTMEPIAGNAELGKKLYEKHCASCHGKKGEGIKAPALANPLFLATASDAFIQYTITEGRAGTPMTGFKDSLNKNEINALTAYLRSSASGWNAPAAITVNEPLSKNYVINPQKAAPKFSFRDNIYVSAKQLLQALKDSTRMIILDARSKAAWQQSHIPGAISVPYYEEPDKFIKNIPKDNTMIVAYCACPHAASTKVVNTLKRYGYKHTAILDEGILVWAQRGYPVEFGKKLTIK